MSKRRTLSFIARSAPHGSGRAKALLDMVLSAAVFEQRVLLMFMGDGLWQLTRGQHPAHIQGKDLSAAFGALPLYDVDQVFVEAAALAERGLNVEDLVIPVILCSAAELAALIADSDEVFAL